MIKEHLSLKLGHIYKNGYGATFKIVKEPNISCVWYEDDNGNYYHKNGCLAQFSDDNYRFNLVEEITK